MRCISRNHLRLIGFAGIAAMLTLTLACIDRPMDNPVPDPHQVWACAVPQGLERDVDLLFVIDNSGSMADEQALLKDNFSALMETLRSMKGGLPNIHIGVASSDLGTGMFQITYCEDAGGDGGRLQRGNCVNPQTVPYIVDVEPRNCEIDKQLDNAGNLLSCTANTCQPTDCGAEPTTTLYEDGLGCPRCRNYENESLEDVFSCVAGLGTLGCGFEQPLEAMYKALDPTSAFNNGFVRDSAYLAVVLITDEDDCSAANPQLFDNTQTTLDSTLGPLTSYRCFEHGITCDINARTHQGLRQNCVPRDDAAALVHSVGRYTQFLRSIKDEQMIMVAAIAGPVTPSAAGGGGNVTVGLDEYSQPELAPSCVTERGGAVPGIRIKSFVEAFNEAEDMTWAFTSICSANYTSALTELGRKIGQELDRCPPSPLKGCTDVAVEYGLPGDGRACNDVCQAECSVTDNFERGTPYEVKQSVPSCLEVCPDGPCPGNSAPGAAYDHAHPSLRDPNLPVAACWHIQYQKECVQSNHAGLVVSRREDPPIRSFTDVVCVAIVGQEQLCGDGVDNDGDCLVDLDDPDCQ